MKKTAVYLLLLSAALAPTAWADNIANCEVLIAERIEDEGTGGSALVSSYRPAAAFISSVYDGQEGHIEEIDGHKVRAVFCQRRSIVPSLRDYPILETGIPLSLSQNFDSAQSDVILIQFQDGAFRSTYTGPGLSEAAQAELDDVLDVFNLQPNDLASREIEKIENVERDISSEQEDITDISIVTLEPNIEPETDVRIFSTDDAISEEAVLEEVVLDEETLAEPEIVDDVPVAAIEPLAENDSNKTATVPTQVDAAEFNATCQLIARDALGALQEIPLSAAGLERSLSASPVFAFPTPAGLNLRGLKCERDNLTPGEHDYKVARAGFPFLYYVKGADGATNRAAALEFVGGKYRMNLLEGDFTDQELIDAKARILSFNDQHLKNILDK